MKCILLVEDDPQITELLELHLNSSSFQIISCIDGETAMQKLETEKIDLVILDIMLPGLNGMEVCKQIRKTKSELPIIMLTSKSDESDKVLALELGADDYVTKPFGILELIARVKALLRRTSLSEMPKTPIETPIHFKDLQVDEQLKKAMMNGQRLDLTPKEFDLLLLLARHPGKSFSRKQLLELVWGFSFQGYEHTVTAHINRLRIKIEPDINKPEYILTAWGIGYRFAE